MRQAMEKWLSRHQITFSTDTANSICSSLGLDGEKVDECIGLCYQLEKGDINQADFTGGLCVLTGKKPEEVMGILKGVRTKIPENPYIVGTQIAKELGIHYDGIQEEIGLQFTDTEQTGTTFYGNTLEEVRAKLVEKRRLFAAKAVPEVTSVTPEVTGILKGMNANPLERVIKPRTEFEKRYALKFEYKGKEIWHFPHKAHAYAIPREIRIGLGIEPSAEELTTYKEIWGITKSPLGYSSVDDFVVLSAYNPEVVYNHLTWLVKNQQATLNIDRTGNVVYIKLLR